MGDTLRCFVVEDEVLPSELLCGYIRQTPWLTLLGNCTDAITALDFLQKNEVDALFLDIHLPQMKGLDVLALLPKKPLVILTTAYHEYALQSYQYDVVDYLLKPFDFARFMVAVEKARRRLQGPAQPMPEALFIKVNKQQVRVLRHEILYMESLKEYCKIHLAQQQWVTQSTLQEMEERLQDERFLRIHRSFIVNTRQITAFTATTISLGKIVLPIGRTYQADVGAFLNKLI